MVHGPLVVAADHLTSNHAASLVCLFTNYALGPQTHYFHLTYYFEILAQFLGYISQNHSLSVRPCFECKIGSECQLRAPRGVSRNRDSLELKSKRHPELPKNTVNLGFSNCGTPATVQWYTGIVRKNQRARK
jgi:hypothetical protein